jgi:hypothetical protein
MEVITELYDAVILESFKMHLDPLLYEAFEKGLILTDGKIAKVLSKRQKKKPLHKARA